MVLCFGGVLIFLHTSLLISLTYTLTFGVISLQALPVFWLLCLPLPLLRLRSLLFRCLLFALRLLNLQRLLPFRLSLALLSQLSLPLLTSLLLRWLRSLLLLFFPQLLFLLFLRLWLWLLLCRFKSALIALGLLGLRGYLRWLLFWGFLAPQELHSLRWFLFVLRLRPRLLRSFASDPSSSVTASSTPPPIGSSGLPSSSSSSFAFASTPAPPDPSTSFSFGLQDDLPGDAPPDALPRDLDPVALSALPESARSEFRRMMAFIVDLFPQAAGSPSVPPPPRALFEDFFSFSAPLPSPISTGLRGSARLLLMRILDWPVLWLLVVATTCFSLLSLLLMPCTGNLH